MSEKSAAPEIQMSIRKSLRRIAIDLDDRWDALKLQLLRTGQSVL